ncbi:MAG: LysM peptidoglycan-binding domain-containing protein [Mangrovibacterium sp.]
MKKTGLLIIGMMILLSSFAQQVKSYTVKSGETIYSICKQYGITQDELQVANPSLNGNLRSGQIIQIPVMQDKVVESQIKFENHKVKRKETLYGISKEYGVTVDDIIRYNPWAEKGIKKKDILRIPNAKSMKQLNDLEDFERENQEAQAKVMQIKHEVKAGETLYGLAKKYNRSIAALLAENPKAESGLKVGMVLTISEMVEQKDAIVVYTVKAGDTAYRIAKNYDITVDDLYAANPAMKTHGLQTNMVLTIPSKVQNVNQVEEWTLQPAEAKPSIEAQLKHYNVAVLLPFSAAEYEYLKEEQAQLMIDAAKNDSIEYTPKTDAELIPAKSKGFMQMYQGILLAINKMREQGMQISVHLFDTEGSLATVKNIVQHPDFRQADLIIGPVYPQVQEPVSTYAKLNHITMVSPLSSAGNFEETNPYYFKVNPTESLIQEKTEYFLTHNFKNYNLLAVGNDGMGFLNQSEEFKQNFAHFMTYDVAHKPTQSLEELGEGDDPNVLRRKIRFAKDSLHMNTVAYIPFNEEAKVSVGVSQLNAAQINSAVTLVVPYSFVKYKSILVEYYHCLNLNVLAPYYIDYSSVAVNDFVKQYRENFYLEPSQFAFQGYDVAYYFMDMMFKYGANVSSAVVSYQPHLLQCSFKFKKISPSAGWVNEGLFLLDYKPNFTIEKKAEL